MLFVVSGFFKAGVEDKLGSLRMAFSDHLMQTSPRIHLGGPLHDKRGAHVGVFFVVEGVGYDQAREMIADSAYTKAGLYDRVEVNSVKLEIGHLV